MFAGFTAEDYLALIPYILGGMCLLGLALGLVLVLGIAKNMQIASLEKYRSKNYGFADLLNYAAIPTDGVIINKNGSLMAAWAFRGPDIECVTKEDRNILSRRLNEFFARFDSGWMVHVDAVRKEVPKYFPRYASHFPDRVSAAVDAERRAFFTGKGTMFDSMFIITFTYMPPATVTRRLDSFLYVSQKSKLNSYQKTVKLLKEFNEKCGDIENRLRGLFDGVERLKSFQQEQADGTVRTYDSFLSYLYFCLYGRAQLMYLPDNPLYLDCMLDVGDFQTGTTPKLGGKFIKCITVENLPAACSPGMLTILGELGCAYRWSSRFIFMDKHEAESHLTKLRQKWKQKRRGFFAQLFNLPQTDVNLAVEEKIDEANRALAEVTDGYVSYGYYTSTIVLMDEDFNQLKSNAQLFIKQISVLGLAAREEKIGCMDAFLGSLPGHGYENVYRPLINTLNFADLIPTSSPWIGSDKNPCPFYPENAPALMQCITGASLNTPFRLNLHEGDLGHTLVLGPTGAGKSTLLATLAIQALRYEGMTVFSFDKGMSMYAVCKAVGGQHFIPAQGEELCFCPLMYLDTKDDLSWASNWLQAPLQLNRVEIVPSIVNNINAALQSMAARHQENPSYSLTLSNFAMEVQDNAVREALSAYLVTGPMGQLLDAEKDGLSGFSNFNVFEIEALWELDEKYRLPVLLYLFRRIEKSLHGQPAMIFLDEAWTVLGHPVFREKIREWLKVLRKANCAVILATQSLSDAERSGILDVLVESTRTKIFLPNPYAVQENMQPLYIKFGLNMAQIRLIAGGTPKRDYFLKGTSQSRMFQLALGPLTLAFVGVSSKDDIKLINSLIEKFGDGWVDEWLSLRGLSIDQFLESAA